MPSLNQGNFIGAAMDSVLQQSYRNLELIVADGGSSDGTIELLKRKHLEDSRLRWFSEKDSGPANALNKAFACASGTIIGWLNSDDLYSEGAIDRALAMFNRNPQWLMLYGHGEHIDQNGHYLNAYPTLPPLTPLDQFAEGCFICQPTVFFRRTQFILLGKLDETLKTAFDFDYWLRAFIKLPGRIGFVEAIQAKSRLHDSCITVKMRRLVALEGLQVLKRHLGITPMHWVLTHVNELLDSCEPVELQYHIDSFVKDVSPFFCDDELLLLQDEIRAVLLPTIQDI